MDTYNNKMRLLQESLKDKKYVEVVIIGVQLLELIADAINENQELLGDEQTEDYFNNDKKGYAEWKKVYKAYKESLKKIKGDEAPRAKVIEILYQALNWDIDDICVDSSLIQKVNQVVKFRNDLAHRYFKENNLNRFAKIRARECLELIEVLHRHPYCPTI